MECSTDVGDRKELRIFEQHQHRFGDEIGIDLEGSARATKAFVRAREIQSPAGLLRLGLMYGTQGSTYEGLAAWALKHGIGDMSGVAVRQRLLHAEEWFRQIVDAMVQVRQAERKTFAGWRVSLQDATVICCPGSQGTDARLHLQLDLGAMRLTGIAVTDAHAGERFTHFPVAPNEIRIGDRGYAFASGMGPVLERGYLIVRSNWQNLPLCDATGQRLNPCAWLRTLSQPGETSVQLPTPQGCFPVRLLAIPLPPQAAEKARARARKAAQKKKHQVSENTLLAAGFLLLITNLPDDLWPLELVAWLYRLRWQIELQFKRFKSLLHLDQVRVFDKHMLQVFLLCKVMAILLLDRLIYCTQQLVPDWFTAIDHPISFWRLTHHLWMELCELIQEFRPIDRLFHLLPKLRRHLCDAPRRRRKQLAYALAALYRLDPSFSIFTF